jgi:hypothetical protein
MRSVMRGSSWRPNVTDAILPDMSESFSTRLQKVRDVVKFFRNGMVSEIFL